MKLTIYWPQAISQEVTEIGFAHRFCKQLSFQNLQAYGNLNWIDYHLEQPLPTALHDNNDTISLVVTDPAIVIPESSVRLLIETLANTNCCAVVPVYNTSTNPDQTAAIPYPYTSISSFYEIASIFTTQKTQTTTATDNLLDFGCFVCSSFKTSTASASLTIDSLCQSLMTSTLISNESLVHRFSNYANHNRPEIIDLIPLSAMRILDVGCGKGQIGRLLKQVRENYHITGVELNQYLASHAKNHYNSVICTNIETFTSEHKFDCIICGDIIEHLNDPWSTVKKLSSMISENGSLIISIPNIGHWSIVKDLLLGKFDYTPAGLSCITHIRWFTEESILRMLEDAGLSLDSLHREIIPATPEGKEFIQKAVAMDLANETSLLTHTLLARAVKN